MKAIAMVPVVCLLLASAAEAGQRPSLNSAVGRSVAVIDVDSHEWQGRLLSVAKDAVTVEIESGTREFKLADVKRVDAHGDSVKDGLIKGALFGLLVSSFVGDARFTVMSTLSYAVVGVGLDALNSCNHTVYRAPAVAAQVKVASW